MTTAVRWTIYNRRTDHVTDHVTYSDADAILVADIMIVIRETADAEAKFSNSETSQKVINRQRVRITRHTATEHCNEDTRNLYRFMGPRNASLSTKSISIGSAVFA